jgi:hypothetical protein
LHYEAQIFTGTIAKKPSAPKEYEPFTSIILHEKLASPGKPDICREIE